MSYSDIVAAGPKVVVVMVNDPTVKDPVRYEANRVVLDGGWVHCYVRKSPRSQLRQAWSFPAHLVLVLLHEMDPV